VTAKALGKLVRDWLVAAGASGGVPNPDRAVILAEQNGTRPPLPYVTVRVNTHRVPIGSDERWNDDQDPPRAHVRGLRYSVVSVQAHGEGAEAWLDRAELLLSSPSILALTQTAGVAIQPQGGATNVSALLDSEIEARWAQDFRVDFVRETSETEVEGVVELAEVQHTDTWQGPPEDRTETVTVTLG
jgi:hypothetical protein